MSYLLFNAVDGTHVREQVQATEDLDNINEFLTEAASITECVLAKLEKFIEDSKEKIEKATSLKTLVLLLKPLEESINMSDTESDKLPTNWRERVDGILKSMSPIFPMAKMPKVNVPNSLLESYISLTLLADKEF